MVPGSTISGSTLSGISDIFDHSSTVTRIIVTPITITSIIVIGMGIRGHVIPLLSDLRGIRKTALEICRFMPRMDEVDPPGFGNPHFLIPATRDPEPPHEQHLGI